MKKLFIVAVCLLVTSFVFGSDVGTNPDSKEFKFTLDWGFDHSEREVELDGEAVFYLDTYRYEYDGSDWYETDTWKWWIESFDGMESLDKMFLNFNFAFGGRYSFYVKTGLARMKAEMFDPLGWSSYEYYEYYYGDEYTYGYSDDYVESPLKGKGKWDPFYGAGFKAVFWESGDFKVGMDLQYNTYKLDTDYDFYRWSDHYWNTWTGTSPYQYLEDEIERVYPTETKTSEYHLALVLSKSGDTFTPYGGFKLSEYKTDYKGIYSYHYFEDYDGELYEYDEMCHWKFSTKPQDIYGFFFGMKAHLSPMVDLNGEIRVGDETAMTAFFSFNF